METNNWYKSVEKEIGSLKEKMSKGDYSAYELGGLLRLTKRISNLSDECSQCAELKGKTINALSGLADWPNTSKEKKDDYIHTFRAIVNHFERYHPSNKGRYLGIGCIVTLFSIGVLLPTLLGLLALLGTDHQWLMFKSFIVVFPLAWISFMTGFRKPFIGGILLFLVGIGTLFGPFIVAAYTDNINGFDLELFWLLPIGLLIGFTLMLSGYLFITSRNGKLTKEKEPDSWDCEECGAEIAKTDKVCPQCGVEFEEG